MSVRPLAFYGLGAVYGGRLSHGRNRLISIYKDRPTDHLSLLRQLQATGTLFNGASLPCFEIFVSNLK